MQTQNPDRTYTPNALATRTGVPARRIRAAIRAGALRASSYGGRWSRISWRDFEAWRVATLVEPETSPEDRAASRVEAALRREARLTG